MEGPLFGLGCCMIEDGVKQWDFDFIACFKRLVMPHPASDNMLPCQASGLGKGGVTLLIRHWLYRLFSRHSSVPIFPCCWQCHLAVGPVKLFQFLNAPSTSPQWELGVFVPHTLPLGGLFQATSPRDQASSQHPDDPWTYPCQPQVTLVSAPWSAVLGLLKAHALWANDRT